MSQVFPTISMDISLFYPISDRLHGYYPIFLPDFHGRARTLPYFRPPHWVLPYFRSPPWILPYSVAFPTASMDITPFYPIPDCMHGHYPILLYFRSPPWILPYFTLFPTASMDITLLSSCTCIARAHSLTHYHT